MHVSYCESLRAIRIINDAHAYSSHKMLFTRYETTADPKCTTDWTGNGIRISRCLLIRLRRVQQSNSDEVVTQ